MAKDSIIGAMAAIIREIGRITLSMAMESMFGKMGDLTKDNGAIAKCTVKEYTLGKMDVFMKGSIVLILSMDKGSIYGLMERNSRALGLKAKDKVRGS